MRAILLFSETLPNDLEGLYSGMFKSLNTLDTTSQALAECTMKWLALSALPSSVVEVEIAVPLLARNLHGLENTDSLEIDTIMDNCSGLVVADPNGTIGLIHYSFHDWMQHQTSNLNLHVAQREIGLICINYISRCARFEATIDEQFRVFPLLSHAIKSWAYHEGKQESPNRVAEFLKTIRGFWLAALKHDGTACVTVLLYFL